MGTILQLSCTVNGCLCTSVFSIQQLFKLKLMFVMVCSALLISVETETVRLMLGRGGRVGLTAIILREVGGYHWCSAIL